MPPDPNQLPDDDQFTSVLAAWDAMLAAGVSPKVNVTDSATPLGKRLLRGLECLQRLAGLWSTGSSFATNLGITSALPPLSSFGRFQLQKELGRGGFGTVYLAHDPQLGREVALKIPRLDLRFHPTLRDRFRYEAQAAARLEHPHIVTVLEAGAVGDTLYIASAYCQGPTLAQWLQERTQPVPCTAAAHFLIAVADAIQHAHSRGVLHRDLKPANILLQMPKEECRMPNEGKNNSAFNIRHSTFGIPKITDFGLAKSLLADEGGATATGEIVGTAAYMAPEQALGKSKEVDTRADVYALGAILYELLTGRPVFGGEDRHVLLEQVRTTEVISPRSVRKDIPLDLETICLKCLAKEPAQRYHSAAALGEDLQRYLRNEPITARPLGRWERTRRWVRRHPTGTALLLTCLVAVFCLLAGLGWHVHAMEAAMLLAEDRRQDAEREKTNALDHARKAEERFQLALYAADGILTSKRGRFQLPLTDPRFLIDLVHINNLYKRIRGELRGKSIDTLNARFLLHERMALLRHYQSMVEEAEEEKRQAQDLLRAHPHLQPTPQLWPLLLEIDSKRARSMQRALELSHVKSRRDQPTAGLRTLPRSPKGRSYPPISYSTMSEESEALHLQSVFQRHNGTTARVFVPKAEDRTQPEPTAIAGISLLPVMPRLQPDPQRLAWRAALVQLWPEVHAFRHELAAALYNRAMFYRNVVGDDTAFEHCLQAACQHLEVVAYCCPTVGYCQDYVMAQTAWAGILCSRGQFAQAQQLLQRAMALWQQACGGSSWNQLLAHDSGSGGSPSTVLYHTALCLLDIHLSTGDHEAAAVMAERLCLSLRRFMGKDDRECWAVHGLALCALLAERDQRLTMTERQRLSQTYISRARQILAASTLQIKSAQWGSALQWGWFLAHAPMPELRDPLRAVKLAQDFLSNETFSITHHRTWLLLALAQYRAGNYAEAWTAVETSRQLLKGGDAWEWFLLAMLHEQERETQQARKWYDKAVQWLQEYQIEDDNLERLRKEAAEKLGLKR